MTKEETQRAFLDWTKNACPSWKDRFNESPDWGGNIDCFFIATEHRYYVEAAFSWSETPEGWYYWAMRSEEWQVVYAIISGVNVEINLLLLRALQDTREAMRIKAEHDKLQRIAEKRKFLKNLKPSILDD